MTFLDLLRREPNALAFGFFCNFASSPGQTFVIALFLPGMKASFGLGDGEISTLYALATVASAATLWRIGRWIDRNDLLAYALASAALLALSCLLVAVAGPLILLAIGLFGLRLSGQGLLSHVGATATGRYFTQGRGKALSMTSLGFSVGEAVFPALVVILVGLWGWRPALVALGGLVMLITGIAVGLVRKNADFRMPRAAGAEKVEPGSKRPARHYPSGSRHLLMSGPLFIAQPLVVTALVFHQAVIAEQKGIPLQAFAVSFIAYALAKFASGLLVGPAIDRFGSRGLFSLHVVPLCVAVGVLVTDLEMWILPVYWLLIGITSGMAATLQVAILAESFPPHRLGAARSVFASAAIFASALGPAIYGALITLGISISAVLMGTVLALVGAIALGLLANRSMW